MSKFRLGAADAANDDAAAGAADGERNQLTKASRVDEAGTRMSSAMSEITF